MRSERLVVGAAIVRAGRVLAARRTRPAAVAGRWEFPGGKVEPGEESEDALVRELAEELGVKVRVTEWLGPPVRIDEEHVLGVALARLVEGDPEPTEHDAIRWLGPDELDQVGWADPDVPFLPQVADALRTPLLRAVFFEEDDAAAVTSRLTREGWVADLIRERFAGEDDEEDHPWAVLTDAPEIVVDLLVDEYDGWLDAHEVGAAPPPSAPLDLPDAPRRIKRPDQL